MTEVVSVEGSSAHLPCDVSPPNPKERLGLVLWYRRDEGEPIYRSERLMERNKWLDRGGTLQKMKSIMILFEDPDSDPSSAS